MAWIIERDEQGEPSRMIWFNEKNVEDTMRPHSFKCPRCGSTRLATEATACLDCWWEPVTNRLAEQLKASAAPLKE